MARPVGRRGETRERVLAAALELFSEHGVGGTSLQMIADRLGLTKAAVYYQFPAKDDIVLAVLQPLFDQLGEVVDAAEAEPDPERRTETLLGGLVDVVLDHRPVMAALQGDPGVSEVMSAHPQVSQVERLGLLLTGPDPDLSVRVSAGMLAGLPLVGADPLLQDVDRADMRR